jgi:hypothetical protein
MRDSDQNQLVAENPPLTAFHKNFVQILESRKKGIKIQKRVLRRRRYKCSNQGARWVSTVPFVSELFKV